MRIAFVLLLAGLLSGPALAHDYGCRHRVVRRPHCDHSNYRDHSYRDHSYRSHSYRGHYHRRVFYRSSTYYGYRGHYGRHRSHRYHACSPYVYRGFSGRVRIAPIYGRLSTVFTLDDAVFDGAEAADADGLPQPRTQPVGARFLK